MQFLNIGIGEIIMVLLIMLIVLGPERMISSARQIGRFVSRMTKSPMWATLMSTSREIRELPTRIVREAGMEETLKEIQQQTGGVTDLAKIQLAQAVEEVNAADQELQSASKEIARQSHPVPFDTKNRPADNEPPAPEEIPNSFRENQDKDIETPGHDSGIEAEDRMIVPPVMIETGEKGSVVDDFMPHEFDEDEPAPAEQIEPAEEEYGSDQLPDASRVG
ncbi:MAG TPA: hypothetical protein VLH85_02130 [Levilinea sp.]|nr:hypothetical protein [Levilinea sp.]